MLDYGVYSMDTTIWQGPTAINTMEKYLTFPTDSVDRADHLPLLRHADVQYIDGNFYDIGVVCAQHLLVCGDSRTLPYFVGSCHRAAYASNMFSSHYFSCEELSHSVMFYFAGCSISLG